MPVRDSVKRDEKLPAKVNVVVIGGGIAGISSALELAERGLSVAVFEKGLVGCEQSGRNWGWCRQMGRDPRELPLIRISMDLWREMRQRTGEEVGFRECGIAYLCESDAKLTKRLNWFESYAARHRLTSRMISAAEAHVMAPGSTVEWKGGLFTPDDGRAEPALAVPAMARAAQRSGALIFERCAVRGLERMAGRVSGVVTERGSVRCEMVVLAGGAWSRRFCHNTDISLPQLTVVNSVARTAKIDAGIEHSIAGADFAIRKRLDGGFTLAHAVDSTADIMPDSFRLLPEFWPLLKTEWRDYHFRIGRRFLAEASLKRRWKLDEKSPFEQVRVLDPTPVRKSQTAALRSLQKTLPAFKNVQIKEEWAGVIDVTPDVVPVISPVESLPGFYIATGFSGHGFGLGPGAGKLMAELVTGETPCVDPAPFRLDRF